MTRRSHWTWYFYIYVTSSKESFWSLSVIHSFDTIVKSFAWPVIFILHILYSVHVKLVTRSSKIFKSLPLWRISRRCCFADLKELKQVPLAVMIQTCLFLPPFTHLYEHPVFWQFLVQFPAFGEEVSPQVVHLLLLHLNWRALARLFNFNPVGVMITCQINHDL